MSATPITHVSLHPQAGATPRAEVILGKHPHFYLELDSCGHGATVFLPGKPEDSTAYLDALIQAATELRDQIAAHIAASLPAAVAA